MLLLPVIYFILPETKDVALELVSTFFTPAKTIFYVDIDKPRDVITGATGATEVAPKFSDILTLSSPGGADSAHHCRGRI